MSNPETPSPESLYAVWKRDLGTELFKLPRARRVFLGQLPLAVTAIIVALLLALQPYQVTPELFLSGFAGIMLLTVISAFVPWNRFSPGWAAVIPLADFIPLGAMIHGSNSTLGGITVLSVFPVLWLAWLDVSRVLTFTAALIGPLAIAWAPFTLGQGQLTSASLVKPLLLPVIILGLAIATTVVTRNLKAQTEGLTSANERERRRARQLDTILKVADVGVVVVDEDGNNVVVNSVLKPPPAGSIPGSGNASANVPLALFDADRTTPATAGHSPVQRAIGGEEFFDELYWYNTGEQQRALSASAKQVYDELGLRHGAVIVFHDVTSVMDAVSAQENFVSSVSHELRTPLTSILGYLELAQDELAPDDETLKHYLTVVERNADRLLDLVNDLLSSSQNAASVSVRQGDLGQVLAAAVSAAIPRAAERRVTLTLNLGPGLDGHFDPVRMAQAVDNLISNAIKFSHHGGNIGIVASRDEQQLMVQVADSGVGMSQAELGQLFTRFYRTEGARSRGIPGVGLGLVITKGIVEGHGGKLLVTSEEGKGTTFTISIPA